MRKVENYGSMVYKEKQYFPIAYWAKYYAVHHTKIRADVMMGKIEVLDLDEVYSFIKQTAEVTFPEDFAKNTIFICGEEAKKIMESTTIKNRQIKIAKAAELRSGDKEEEGPETVEEETIKFDKENML